ncbi:MAG: DUF6600 domain-containing protein [Candidatus Binatia bacterium]
MRSRIVLAFAVLLALAAAGPLPARADWDDRPDASEYEQSLSPHGYWVDDGSFGRVWRPSVGWDWRPYSDGQWIWTSYGWTWSSYEPWAWTFHYGNWGFSNLYGWVWAPGYVWGPAWVNWYWGDGFVGWAPLGIGGFAVIPSYWSYVHDYHFCAPRVNNVIVTDRRYLPDYIVHHRQNGWGREKPPALRDIQLVSRHQIERRGDRPNDSIAPWVHRRFERGEHVRERVADRGTERVIEHAGRPRDRKDAPPVADDGSWRRPRGDGRDRPDGFVRPGQPRGGDLTHRPAGAGDDRGRDRPVFVEPRRGWAAPPVERRGPERQRTLEASRPEPRGFDRPQTGRAGGPPSAAGSDRGTLGHERPSGGARPVPQGSAGGGHASGGGVQGGDHGGARGGYGGGTSAGHGMP